MYHCASVEYVVCAMVLCDKISFWSFRCPPMGAVVNQFHSALILYEMGRDLHVATIFMVILFKGSRFCGQMQLKSFHRETIAFAQIKDEFNLRLLSV